LSAMHETGSMPLSTGLIREDIHDSESELLRIPIPRTPVNKGKRKGRGYSPQPSLSRVLFVR